VTPALRRARRVLIERLRGEEGYSGVGVGEDAHGRTILVVFVEGAGCPAHEAAPAAVQGVPVKVEVTGRARKQGPEEG
jgi:hypothetical protein